MANETIFQASRVASRLSMLSFERKQLSQCLHGVGCSNSLGSKLDPGSDAVVAKYCDDHMSIIFTTKTLAELTLANRS